MATSDKYDRQLRLWGASGQRALGGTTIVLINATASGTETLKFPGVGAIHVVDSADAPPVPKSGAGREAFDNFFVFDDSSANEMEVEGADASATDGGDASSNSPARAEVACKYLCELNPDVSGDHTTVPSLSSANYGSVLDDIVKKQSTTPSPSLLIVASDLPPKPLLNLSREAWDRGIPLLIVRSCGLIGSVRLQVEDHPVVESKPDSTVPDLRLADPSGPFPALKALVDATDMDSMDNAEHSHVPYVIILLKALAKWRSGLSSTEDATKSDMLAGEVRFPKSTAEKDSFRATIKSMARNFNDELNFQEACGDAYLAYAEREIPWEVQELLDATTDESVTATIQKFAASGAGFRNVRFAVLLLALKRFLAQSDVVGRSWPPLDGKIPDMTASTEPYIALQGVYKQRADEDRAAVRAAVDAILSEQKAKVGDGSTAVPDVPDEDVAAFCRNVQNLRKVVTRPYAEEWETHAPSADGEDAPMPTPQEEEIRGDLMMATMDPYEVPEHTPLLWHCALRAADVFCERNGRYPGTPLDADEKALEADAKGVQAILEPICSTIGLADTDLVKSTLLGGSMAHAAEITRYGNAELHNVASVLGGVASQEAVKIITGQYVPLDNTYVYNGIAGTAGVYKF
eukprot:CAMPEP_0181039792 /NCGR_PEP_ID=MMETSP1070-20121207/10684_1 /TAXON_ID=265543 /ORGANISM="Minutocellus polymorphus, Strain NH13" /LENGTH=632 /DNA_ID=CAMNT_0023117719 /DNA_START=27 /DNA_END=1925 /DNA_ORIENTATION=-